MRESDTNYPEVICILSDRIRVINCRNNIQWILHKSDKNGRRWRGLSYHLHRSSLIRDAKKQGVDTTPLEALPERHWSLSMAGCASKSVKDDPTYQSTLEGSEARRFLDAYSEDQEPPMDTAGVCKDH